MRPAGWPGWRHAKLEHSAAELWCSSSVRADLEWGKLAGCKMALSRIGLVSLKLSETVTVLTLAPRGWRCRVEMLVNCDRSEVDETPTSRSDLQT